MVLAVSSAKSPNYSFYSSQNKSKTINEKRNTLKSFGTTFMNMFSSNNSLPLATRYKENSTNERPKSLGFNKNTGEHNNTGTDLPRKNTTNNHSQEILTKNNYGKSLKSFNRNQDKNAKDITRENHEVDLNTANNQSLKKFKDGINSSDESINFGDSYRDDFSYANSEYSIIDNKSFVKNYTYSQARTEKEHTNQNGLNTNSKRGSRLLKKISNSVLRPRESVENFLKTVKKNNNNKSDISLDKIARSLSNTESNPRKKLESVSSKTLTQDLPDRRRSLSYAVFVKASETIKESISSEYVKLDLLLDTTTLANQFTNPQKSNEDKITKNFNTKKSINNTVFSKVTNETSSDSTRNSNETQSSSDQKEDNFSDFLECTTIRHISSESTIETDDGVVDIVGTARRYNSNTDNISLINPRLYKLRAAQPKNQPKTDVNSFIAFDKDQAYSPLGIKTFQFAEKEQNSNSTLISPHISLKTTETILSPTSGSQDEILKNETIDDSSANPPFINLDSLDYLSTILDLEYTQKDGFKEKDTPESISPTKILKTTTQEEHINNKESKIVNNIVKGYDEDCHRIKAENDLLKQETSFQNFEFSSSYTNKRYSTRVTDYSDILNLNFDKNGNQIFESTVSNNNEEYTNHLYDESLIIPNYGFNTYTNLEKIKIEERRESLVNMFGVNIFDPNLVLEDFGVVQDYKSAIENQNTKCLEEKETHVEIDEDIKTKVERILENSGYYDMVESSEYTENVSQNDDVMEKNIAEKGYKTFDHTENTSSAFDIYEVSKKSASKINFRFDETVLVYETFNSEDYDRSGYPAARITPESAYEIKKELNEYKFYEMEVHKDSAIYTHYIL
ncbi:hypothetical protein BB558_002671 [Smittium angustum]|uniref:Uncharacterized protein n=1 Tax=Smittium angustum TaxID=133377 RepID=A0A2U1J7Z7_SMIAN|nr:hypothetical protein BB558_002671 [Smittium angustum]